MKIRFLGTGAADWKGPDARGEHRRLTSTLINDSLLIDFTATVSDMLTDPSSVQYILITHSHADHFDPEAIATLAPAVLFAHESWPSASGFRRAMPKSCRCPPIIRQTGPTSRL